MKLKSIFNLSVITRLSIGIISMLISILMIADIFFDVFSDKEQIEREKRKSLAENLAIQLVVLASSDNRKALNKTLEEVTIKNPQILSVGVRRAEGWLAYQQGNHKQHWPALQQPGQSTTNHLSVPIYSKQELWGNIEVNFKPQQSNGFLAWLSNPTFLFLLTFSLVGSGLIYLYLRRAMHYLNPSAAVPERVQKAFDVLTDGILVLDKNGYIVLANQTFTTLNSLSEDKIYGRLVMSLPLIKKAVHDVSNEALPWEVALKGEEKPNELPITIDEGEKHNLIISSQSITDSNNKIRGCLVSFKNVTELHKANLELTHALDELKKSRALIEKSHDELEVMASRDPLTGCLNRRAFFQQAEDEFTSALQGNRNLFCIMADIDFFKSFNDIYGHYIGDQVIQAVAKIFNTSLRPSDLICRYGGEEFCILLSDLALDNVIEVCERMRKTIEETGSASIRTKKIKPVTMSFGIAAISDGIDSLENLIDFADNALYISKESGRNQVTVWENPELY